MSSYFIKRIRIYPYNKYYSFVNNEKKIKKKFFIPWVAMLNKTANDF